MSDHWSVLRSVIEPEELIVHIAKYVLDNFGDDIEEKIDFEKKRNKALLKPEIIYNFDESQGTLVSEVSQYMIDVPLTYGNLSFWLKNYSNKITIFIIYGIPRRYDTYPIVRGDSIYRSKIIKNGFNILQLEKWAHKSMLSILQCSCMESVTWNIKNGPPLLVLNRVNKLLGRIRFLSQLTKDDATVTNINLAEIEKLQDMCEQMMTLVKNIAKNNPQYPSLTFPPLKEYSI